MSELYQEQDPLLCEELSDEAFNAQFYRRLRPVSFRGRARNNLKGAAAILTRWPDHWTSFLTYWWIGLGMICLMTFFIYNSLLAFPMIQIANAKPAGFIETNSIESTTQSSAKPLEVYMHIFVEENAEINLNDYLPYIEKVSNKYTEFKYHLLIVYNDTHTNILNAEKNNVIALDSLWTKSNSIKKEPLKRSNVKIEYTSLTTHMDNSPLKKFWRRLPHQLIEFLARAVSIWNKGGVSFNPNFLTTQSRHSIYIEKLKKILHKFSTSCNTVEEVKQSEYNHSEGLNQKHKVNSIQDIINALEKSNDTGNIISHETLSAAENKELPVIAMTGNQLFTTVKEDNIDEPLMSTNPISIDQVQPNTTVGVLENNTKQLINESRAFTDSIVNLKSSNDTSKQSLLPLFLKYLFNNKPSDRINSTQIQKNGVHRKRKSVLRTYKNDSHTSHVTETKGDIKYEPILISANVKSKLDLDNDVIGKTIDYETHKEFDSNHLIIDLKGNIIATGTSCHAFLGTMFSNAIHHNEEESVTDFIIAELSVFCKGLLSSCMGIDLILL